MPRSNAISWQVYSACCFARALLALALLAMIASNLQSQETGQPASLRGMIRDSQGKAINGVTIHLQAKDSTKLRSGFTDIQGNYSFDGLPGGVYVLRAELAGFTATEIPSLFFAPGEAKSLDLILVPVTAKSQQEASRQAPQFFDEPQFAIAGVTDTTNLGGHGSDTIVRARETLAKETVSLSEGPASARPVASSEKEKSLREAVDREPRSFEASRDLGKALDENGRSREAIPYLERAGELNPGDYEVSYALALANAHAGNDDRARAEAQALLAKHDRAELHHLLADTQEKAGNSLEAVHEYQRAAELDPREPYIFDWGSELLLHHAPEPAVEVFTKGNRLFPKSMRMLIGLSAAQFAQGAFDQAIQKICEASDLNPQDPSPYLFMGKMQAAESNPSPAIVERLRRFAELETKNAQANYYYAVSLWTLRKEPTPAADLAQIEALLQDAIDLNPKFAAAHLQLGILHSEQKEYSKAIADYQEAIQSDPRMEQAHFRLAQAYRRAGEAARAEAELKRYDEIAKESAQEVERERHAIRQFVYVLRDQPPAQIP